MALKPAQGVRRAAQLRLTPFDPTCAELLVSWVRDEQETLWLAPKTAPPLNADHVRRWNLPGHEQLQLIRPGRPTPLAYGELNRLNRANGHFWLGHLIVPPARRGHGLGRELTRQLLNRAFNLYGAQQVSLVVFPANRPAIACYRAAGMRPNGYEEHDLPAYGRHVHLLRMVATPGA